MIEQNAKGIILKLAEENKRIDGRKLDEFRELQFEYDISDQAEGSVSVKLGNTEVYAGVKMKVGKPFSDTPDQGNLMVNAEIAPTAGEEYEPGPPKEWEVTMSRVIDRGIRESHCIDDKKLVITAGEYVWEVFVDIYVINDDGNLIDAGGIAAAAALAKTKIPEYDSETMMIPRLAKKEESLELLTIPIPVTIAKINNILLVDANKEETSNADAKLTITVDGEDHIVSMQRDGPVGFTREEIDKCLKIAVKKSKEVRKKVMNS